ncbi:RND transporter [Raoultella ornithinolytica]|uniref:RND transporter n=1 Tax=Raoultella ornithinolytica TaxID=54291 RepID=UPI00227541FA|nr:RND transporter [Raoultella ornithinolytica]EKQ8001590.1 RND transporter [Raoultella ornithinolytica]EKU0200078.1 RND transporter [Raoultella ornithinolytica]EKU0200685.1 RND transporter [Raoultella ornithinolytica]EKV4103456.1 RND transporter [Raoultella ornithinolytica]EKV8288455.1 RND transporter [Raoultella ornithinolytica]
MKKNITGILVLYLILFLHPAYAEDCEDNGLGGSFCINDDGTTTDSIQNEINGQETYSSDGSLTSTSPLEDGNDQMLSGSEFTDSDNAINNTLNSRPDKKDDPLIGKDWNSPSYLSSDGSAVSSFSRDK